MCTTPGGYGDYEQQPADDDYPAEPEQQPADDDYPAEPEQPLYDDVEQQQEQPQDAYYDAAAGYGDEPELYDDVQGQEQEPEQPLYDDVQGQEQEPEQPLYDDLEGAEEQVGAGVSDCTVTLTQCMYLNKPKLHNPFMC